MDRILSRSPDAMQFNFLAFRVIMSSDGTDENRNWFLETR